MTVIDESPLCRALEEEILAMSRSRRIWQERARAAEAQASVSEVNRRVDEILAKSNAQERELKLLNDALLAERRNKDAAHEQARLACADVARLMAVKRDSKTLAQRLRAVVAQVARTPATDPLLVEALDVASFLDSATTEDPDPMCYRSSGPGSATVWKCGHAKSSHGAEGGVHCVADACPCHEFLGTEALLRFRDVRLVDAAKGVFEVVGPSVVTEKHVWIEPTPDGVVRTFAPGKEAASIPAEDVKHLRESLRTSPIALTPSCEACTQPLSAGDVVDGRTRHATEACSKGPARPAIGRVTT